MQCKSIQKSCMGFVLAVTAAFTLGGCTVGINDGDDNGALTPTRGTVNASSVTNDNKQPSRLQSIQDKIAVQHR